MSWDISIQDLPTDVQCVEDIPDDFQPIPLGPRSDLIARFKQILPEVDFSDESWGMLEVDGYSIEFNMGSHDICDGFMLHVRGGGNAVPVIVRLLEHLNLRGIDCQTGEFFSPQAAESSFGEWQAYCNRVIRPEDTSE